MEDSRKSTGEYYPKSLVKIQGEGEIQIQRVEKKKIASPTLVGNWEFNGYHKLRILFKLANT